MKSAAGNKNPRVIDTSYATENTSKSEKREYRKSRAGRRVRPSFRTALLRLLSSLAVNIYIYALVTAIRTILFYDDGGAASVLVYTCGFLTAYLSGCLLAGRSTYIAGKLSRTKVFRFIAYALGIRRMDQAIASLAAWLVIIVPAALPFAIFRGDGILRPLLESAATCCAYIVSFMHTRMEPADIIGGGGFYAGLLILGGCLELHYMADVITYLRPWFFRALYFLIFVYLVVRNQDDIDDNIYDKKYVEKSILPKNLRRVNTVSAIFIFLVLMFLSNFKTVVSGLVRLAGRFVRTIIIAVVSLLEKITPDTGGDSGMSGPEELAPQFGEAPPSPYLDLVFNILKYFIVLYLSYKLVCLIISKIPAIVTALAKLLRKLFRIRTDKQDYEGSDYIDEAEIVLPERAERDGRRARKSKRRTARQLRKIKDPVERVRYMYGLILDTLPLRGIKPLPSDTTAEILAKAGGTDGLHPFTAIYDHVRYGGMVPDKETLAKAEAHYEKAYDTISGRFM